MAFIKINNPIVDKIVNYSPRWIAIAGVSIIFTISVLFIAILKNISYVNSLEKVATIRYNGLNSFVTRQDCYINTVKVKNGQMVERNDTLVLLNNKLSGDSSIITAPYRGYFFYNLNLNKKTYMPKGVEYASLIQDSTTMLISFEYDFTKDQLLVETGVAVNIECENDSAQSINLQGEIVTILPLDKANVYKAFIEIDKYDIIKSIINMCNNKYPNRAKVKINKDSTNLAEYIYNSVL